MRKLFIIPACLIILLASAWYIIEKNIKNYWAYSAIRPARVTKEQLIAGHPDMVDPSKMGMRYSDFNITVEDTILLKGWFISTSKKPARGTVILLHGISSCKNMMLPLAKELTNQGYNCICYDSRANGESGGLNCTFGYYEKNDVSRYIDSAIVRYPHSAPYGIMGHSLGAAVALQAMAIDKRIVCGIAESPFADLKNTLRDYFERMAHIKLDFIPDRALEYSEKIAGFSADSVSPALAAKNITQPVMIIHGLSDEHINSKYGKLDFDNIASVHKFWYPIAGGTHTNLAEVGGKKLDDKIKSFLSTYLGEDNSKNRTKSY
jgi:alpha-beta hydrolase superfamily lysophospholipase